MARPNLSEDRRRELLPLVARAFAELGYRRATIAELAQRCGVRENVLYRLWPDKKAMFLASIDHVFDVAMQAWASVLAKPGDGTPAERILAYESTHYGETGLYRIVFAGLSESDDADIRAALRQMYGRFHRFVAERIGEHRRGGGDTKAGPPAGSSGGDDTGGGAFSSGGASSSGRLHRTAPDPGVAAWAIIGLGTVSNIMRELRLVSAAERARLFREAGRLMLEAAPGSPGTSGTPGNTRHLGG